MQMLSSYLMQYRDHQMLAQALHNRSSGGSCEPPATICTDNLAWMYMSSISGAAPNNGGINSMQANHPLADQNHSTASMPADPQPIIDAWAFSHPDHHHHHQHRIDPADRGDDYLQIRSGSVSMQPPNHHHHHHHALVIHDRSGADGIADIPGAAVGRAQGRSCIDHLQESQRYCSNVRIANDHTAAAAAADDDDDDDNDDDGDDRGDVIHRAALYGNLTASLSATMMPGCSSSADHRIMGEALTLSTACGALQAQGTIDDLGSDRRYPMNDLGNSNQSCYFEIFPEPKPMQSSLQLRAYSTINDHHNDVDDHAINAPRRAGADYADAHHHHPHHPHHHHPQMLDHVEIVEKLDSGRALSLLSSSSSSSLASTSSSSLSSSASFMAASCSSISAASSSSSASMAPPAAAATKLDAILSAGHANIAAASDGLIDRLQPPLIFCNRPGTLINH
jgi:hypothetical protein